jgi:hypothetical protein
MTKDIPHVTATNSVVPPVTPKKFEAPIGKPVHHQEAVDKAPVLHDDRTISASEQAERDWLDEPKDLLAERTYARAEGKTVAPRAIPESAIGTIRVKNVHKQIVYLASGPLEPGAEGLATKNEVGRYADKYLLAL